MRSWRLSAGVLAAGLVFAAGAARAPAQAVKERRTPGGAVATGPLKREILKEPDVRDWLVQRAVDAARKGTALHREGKHQECYQYYVATLFAVTPFIYEDDLKARAQAALFVAAQEPYYDRAAVYLRTVLNDIRNRNDLVKGPDGKFVEVGPDKRNVERPLFERLGGREAVQSVVKMAYDRAKEKNSGVNLDRGGEYPYTPERAQRMQKATVDLIQMLSEKQKPATPAAAEPKQPDAGPVAELRDRLNKELQAAVADLTKAAEQPKLDEAQVKAAAKKVSDLNKQVAALDAALAAMKPAAGAGTGAAGSVSAETLAYMKKAHRTMRITDEEFAAAMAIFRECLELHAVPEKEIDELIDVVEKLRPGIVLDVP